MNSRTLPAFASEADEAAWWYENREKLDENFEQALSEGRVRHGSAAQRLAATRGAAIITLAPPDAKAAAGLAAQSGLELNVYLTGLVHKAIQQELESITRS